MQNSKPNISESSLYFFLKLILGNWRKLFLLYFVVGVITVITLFIIPEWYKGTATVVILEEKGATGLNSALTNMIPLGLGGFGGADTERYIQFVRTKKLMDQVIDKYDLFEVYESKFVEDAYSSFNENFQIYNNDNNTFNISFLYKNDPEKAAEITNYIFEVLDGIALEVDKAQASNFRNYLGNYLQNQESKLEQNREKLIDFQHLTGIFDIQRQIEATITSLAELEITRTEVRIQLEYLRVATSENSSEFKNLKTRLDVLNNEIDLLRKSQELPLIGLDELPEKAAEFIQLTRDIFIGEKVTEFIRLQYEESLIDEQKVSSNLYLLDPAQVPEKRFKPQRTRTLIIVMFFTVLISLIYLRLEHFYYTNKSEFSNIWNS